MGLDTSVVTKPYITHMCGGEKCVYVSVHLCALEMFTINYCMWISLNDVSFL